MWPGSLKQKIKQHNWLFRSSPEEASHLRKEGNIQITEGRTEQTTLIISEKLRFVLLGNIFNPFLILFLQTKS